MDILLIIVVVYIKLSTELIVNTGNYGYTVYKND